MKLANWFRRRRLFLNFIDVLSPFRYYLPLEKGMAVHLNKLESPSANNALWHVWLKLALWFRDEAFESLKMSFLYFIISPLVKGRGPTFEQTWIHVTQGCFVPSLVEIGPVVLKRKMKMWRFKDRRTDRHTIGSQKSLLELLAQLC